MSKKQFDLAVLGGGTSVPIATRAADAGLSVALIERDLLGGACPNRGCVPSKLFLGFADAAEHIREVGRFHIDAKIDSIDQDRIFNEVVDSTFRSTNKKIEAKLPDGVELFRGEGRFVDDHTIQVNGEEIEAKTIVIGTGSRPFVPEVNGLEGTPYWTSDHVFELDKAPKSITIVGGGYIACELGYFFAGIGIETTLIARGDTLLRAEDKEIREVFQPAFTETVDVKFDTGIESVSHDGDQFHLQLKGKDGTSSEHTSERLLFAVGRRSNGDDLGLEKTGIETNAKGDIQVDDHLRTAVENVYAFGDVIGSYQFTHSAAFAATYLGDVILKGKEGPLVYPPMPHAVFSRPEIAGVGQTEDQLEKAGTPFLAASLPYTTAAKGRAVKEQNGLCKIILAEDGTILGCHIVGYHASTLIHEVIPVMMWRNHISSLTDIIHIHPSLSEIVRNTARQAAALLK